MIKNNLIFSKTTLVGVVAVLAALSASVVAHAQDVPAHNPDGMIALKGIIQTAATDKLTVQTATGVLTVKLVQPFHIYMRAPSSLADVKATSFIGVTTVKQPDGTQQATEIHVFPEALRGIGEGSYMMKGPSGSTPSRMTNGKVAASHMASGTPSRMTNGSVKLTSGSALVVQYQGGVQHIIVPPNTPVMGFQLTTEKLTPGQPVFLMAKKAADGSYSSNEAITLGK